MLYTQPPKKMLIVHILDILRRYSDADHRLSQKDILEILRREYETEADRKAIKRNLANLMEAGIPSSTPSASAKTQTAKRKSSARTGIWSGSFPIPSCSCSSTVCCSPGTFPTASAGS